MTDALLSLIIGALMLVGFSIDSKIPDQITNNIATSTVETQIVKTEKKSYTQESVKKPTNDVAEKNEKNTGVIPTPLSTVPAPLPQPQEQYSDIQDIIDLNAEAIAYFKTHNTCDGLVGFKLTYCKAFTGRPRLPDTELQK